MKCLLLAALLALGLSPAFAQAPPPVPALPDTPRQTTYTLVGGQTCACAVGFQLYGDNNDVDAWIHVFLNGQPVLSTDPTFGWSLSSATGPLLSIPRPITDAILTFNSVQTGTVEIVGAQRPRRLTQFQEGRGVAARDLNQAFTTLFAQNRENWDRVGNTTGISGTYATGFAGGTPGACLTYDSQGDIVTMPCPASVANTINREIWANDFGAACDGSTDDHLAFQNTIATAFSFGFPMKFIGDCVINTGLSITNTIDLSGVQGIQSVLLCAPNITCLTANTTSPVFIHDFQITPLTSGTGTALQIGTSGNENVGSFIYRMFLGGFTALKLANAAAWTVYNNSLTSTNASSDAVYAANTTNPDNGSDAFYGNIISSTVSGGNAVHWQSGGGVRFINNTIIGTAFQRAFFIDESASIHTSDIWITNNHIEGSEATGAVCIQLQRNGAVSTLGNVVITSNECAGWDVGVLEPLDGSGPWLSSVTIGDNVIGTSGNAAATNYGYELLTEIVGLSIHHGAFLGVSGTASGNVVVKLGTQTATECAVGPIPKSAIAGSGALGASTLSSCTSYTPN